MGLFCGGSATPNPHILRPPANHPYSLAVPVRRRGLAAARSLIYTNNLSIPPTIVIIPLKTYFRITANVLIMGLILLLQLLRYKTDVAKVSFRKKKIIFTTPTFSENRRYGSSENKREKSPRIRENGRPFRVTQFRAEF